MFIGNKTSSPLVDWTRIIDSETQIWDLSYLIRFWEVFVFMTKVFIDQAISNSSIS